MENAVQTKKTRKDYLDYAKAIGIFLVVWGHLLSRQTDPHQVALEIKMMIYSFHMPLFFVISGMGLWYKLEKSGERSMKKEVGRMAQRLLLPYLFWCVVYTAIKAAKFLLFEKNLSRLLSEGYRLLTGNIVPMWFLYNLFMAEAVFLFIWNILKHKNMEKSYIAWGGVLIITSLITLAIHLIFERFELETTDKWLYYIILPVFRFFPSLFFVSTGYFALLTAKKKHSLYNSRAKLLLGATVMILLWLAVCRQTNVNLYSFQIDNCAVSFLASGVLGSFAVVLFCKLLPDAFKPLLNISKESLHIMALHYPPMPVYKVFLLLSDKFIGSSLTIFASLATGAACYFFAVYVFEPICEFLKRVFNKGKT